MLHHSYNIPLVLSEHGEYSTLTMTQDENEHTTTIVNPDIHSILSNDNLTAFSLINSDISELDSQQD